ncbi:MAG: carbohydrate kinase family protein [Bacilli bacterium]
MKKILCLGNASYDITIPVGDYPEENTKIRVNKKEECGGGSASNAAYLLGKWKSNVYFCGTVGEDLYGNKIKEEFNSVNVKLDYFKQDKLKETTTSYVIANIDEGSRTILVHQKEDTESNIDIMEDFDILLIDGHEPTLSKKIIESGKIKHSIIDASRNKPEIIELSKMVDYLICSKNFAENYTGIEINIEDNTTILEIYGIMKKNFNNNIIITLGEHGCLYSIENKIKIMPSLKMEAIDSTGAGDIFHGAFAYALGCGYDFEDCLRISTIAGALSVIKIGSRNSVPNLEDVLEIFEKRNG